MKLNTVVQNVQQLLLTLLLTQMDIQIKNSHQQQLNQLLQKNQDLIAKRSDQLFAKLETLINEGGELQFSNSVNLEAALEFFKTIQQNKKKQTSGMFAYQAEIDREMLSELEIQNNKLLSEIAEFQREIKQFKQNKANYELAQKYTSKRILANQQLLIKNSLDLCKESEQKQIGLNYGTSFAYNSKESKSDFKQSYVDIVDHFIRRIEQNQLILSTLEKSIQYKVKQGQRIKLKINKIQQICKEVEFNDIQIKEINKKNEEFKDMLRIRMKQVHEVIEQALPQLIDNELNKIKQQKSGYQKAYHSLLEVLNKVVKCADIPKSL